MAFPGRTAPCVADIARMPAQVVGAFVGLTESLCCHSLRHMNRKSFCIEIDEVFPAL